MLLICEPSRPLSSNSKPPSSDLEPLVTPNHSDSSGPASSALHRARNLSRSLSGNATAVDLSDALAAAGSRPSSHGHHSSGTLLSRVRAFLARHLRASLWFIPTALLYGINNNLGAHLQVQMDAATYQVGYAIDCVAVGCVFNPDFFLF